MYLRNVKTQFRHHWMLIFLALLWLPLTVFSQTAMIDGTVMCGEQPIVGAKVVFTPEYDQEVRYTAVTDTAGYFQLSVVTGVDEQPATVPQQMELLQNYPNPFSNGTVIAYQLNRPGAVSVTIYDVLGRQVRSFTEQQQAAGMHNISWDGRNAQGANVATGIYFYRIKSGGQVMTKKMLYTGAEYQVRQHSNFAYSQAEIRDKETTTGGTHYSITISNNDGTIPRIESANHEVTVQADTTLALGAETVEQWQYLGLQGELIMSIAVDPVDPAIIYAGSRSLEKGGAKLFKSTDAGVTWDTLLVGRNPYSWEIMIDPENHNHIYVTLEGLLFSQDGGDTWTDTEANKHVITQYLAMNPKDYKVLYSGGTGSWILGTPGSLHRSNDGGITWLDAGSEIMHAGVYALAINPVDTNIVYAASLGLWQSMDGGQDWQQIDLPRSNTVYEIYCHENNPNHIYLATRGGVLFSDDAGQFWFDLDDGLQDMIVKHTKFSNSGRLFACVQNSDHGGVFEYSSYQRQWIRTGIHVADAIRDYYWGEMVHASATDKLYFGSNGIYVMELKY